jgi:PAS domain S-box-containing protein
VVKAAQAVSGEIVLGKLIETLMRIALEHAGAERGLLILFLGDEPWIEAEATTSRNRVDVTLRQTAVSPAELPESVLQYVIRTRESVILDDAEAPTLFSADAYVRQRRPRSVLCLPLVKQAKLVGALYLENNLTPHAFTSGRIAVLELLASQAAISLENARLYNDLQEREARIRRLVDSNIIGILIWDFQGRIVDANEAFLDIVGYAREDLVSGRLRWTELTPAEWREADEQAIAELKAAGTVQPREKEYFRKDGSRVPVLLGAARFGDHKDEGVAFVLDLTERKQTESALQRSEAFLADGQRMSRTGSWDWNVSTGKLVWSEEHYRIFGFSPGGEAGPTFQSFLERVHSEDRPFVQQNLEAAILDRTGFAFDFRIALPDGSIKYLHGVGRPIVEETGDIHEYVGTTMDVSERKQSEDALRDAQADLARAARLATMGELTTLIAHEVSQPLMAIVTNADTCLSWLTKADPNLDGARQAAERVVRNGHRAGSIVKSIRALARKSEPEMAQFDINDAIAEILVLLRSELRRQSVSLETELSESIESVTGDRVQLQQVVLNLVMNGIEAMSAVMHRPRILRVTSQLQQSGDVLIAVTDVGTGLDPANMDRIFNAFFTTKPEGMGMGLAICRSIVEAHGGLLWASPQLPHGSVFQFTVPARNDRRGPDNAASRG